MGDLAARLSALPLAERAEFLARLRAVRDGSRRDTVLPYADRGEAPLTSTQRTLWFIEQLATGKATYHLPHYWRLRGGLDVAALRRALAGVASRHGVLRTRVDNRDGGPVQVVEDAVAVTLPVVDVTAHDGDAVAQALHRAAREVSIPPFALDQAPLWRARLYRIAPDDHVFVFVVHHLVFDGASVDLFYRELAELYRAETTGDGAVLPELPVQYTDFARWQQERLASGELERLEAYWRNQLTGAPDLDLPTDRPRPAEVTFRGGALAAALPPGLGGRVIELARGMNTTAYVVYLAAYWTMLSRLSGQNDIVIGASTTGRHRPELANLLGFFVTVLGLRGRFAARSTFRQVVMEADRVLRDALAHSDIPFEQVVQAVRPKRDLSRSPIFQVSLAVTGDGADAMLGDVRVSPLYHSHGTARFDIAWAVAGTRDISVAVEYSTDLYDAARIQRMIHGFGALLAAALDDPDLPVAELPLEAGDPVPGELDAAV